MRRRENALLRTKIIGSDDEHDLEAEKGDDDGDEGDGVHSATVEECQRVYGSSILPLRGSGSLWAFCEWLLKIKFWYVFYRMALNYDMQFRSCCLFLQRQSLLWDFSRTLGAKTF